MKKIILINIAVLIVIGIISELSSYIVLCCKYKKDIIDFIKIETGKDIKIPYIKYQMVKLPSREQLLSNFRPVEKRNPNKKPIILFGCSYTYGFGLNEDETFSRKLADFTDRTVINRGKSGTGIPFMYYQLSDEKVVKELPKDTEYVIFTLISDHFRRLFRYRNFVANAEHTLRYKITEKDGEKILVEDRPIFPFLHSLFTSIVIEENIEKNSAFGDKMDTLFIKLMSESNKLIKKNFPNAKFVVIYFECPTDIPNSYNKEIRLLSKNIEDITVFRVKKEVHQIRNNPTGEAWDKIIPVLSEKLHLNE